MCAPDVRTVRVVGAVDYATPDHNPEFAMRRPRQKAFTLIELLVVVSIIALLVSILLPALSKARELAKRSICSVNMRTVGTALFTYDSDFGYVPHPTVTEKSKVTSSNSTGWRQSLYNRIYQNEFEVGPEMDRTGVGWFGLGALLPNDYVGDDAIVLWCPSKPFRGDGTYPHHNQKTYSEYHKWQDFFAANPHGYGYNYVLSAYRYQAIEPVDLMAGGQLVDLGAQRFGVYADRRKTGPASKVALLDEPGSNSDLDPTVVEGSTHEGGINAMKWDTSVRYVRKNFAEMAQFRYSRMFVQWLDLQ